MSTTDAVSSQRQVGYLGPPSSYTHQATVDNFEPEHWQLKPQASIADVFHAVQDGSVTYGVVPFENSSNGAVIQTLDLFADRAGAFPDVHIVGETFVEVRHCLLGFSDGSAPGSLLLEDETGSGEATPTQVAPSPARSRTKPRRSVQHITKVYSHPQALGQCDAFLSVHLRGAERLEVSSTSRAAQIVSEDTTRTSAAISSRMAAEEHGLEMLAASIEDRPDNETRFFVIKRGEGLLPKGMEPPLPTFMQELADELVDGNGKDSAISSATAPPAAATAASTATRGAAGSSSDAEWKSLISFTIDQNETGALSKVLDLFRDSGLSLASINSRPTRGRPWHYVFFIEFGGKKSTGSGGGSGGESKVGEAIVAIEKVTEGCRWHGSWKRRGGI